MKKFLLSMFTLASMVFLFNLNVNAADVLLTYELTDISTVINSSSSWNASVNDYNEQSSTDITPIISDFTNKLTLEITSSNQVIITFRGPWSMRYNDRYDYGDYTYENLSLFSFGKMNYPDTYFSYDGDYGDAEHRSGADVKPFFLFLEGSEKAPIETKYNSSIGCTVSTFNDVSIPIGREFTFGISFSTFYTYYYESSGVDYYSTSVSSSDIIQTKTLFIPTSSNSLLSKLDSAQIYHGNNFTVGLIDNYYEVDLRAYACSQNSIQVYQMSNTVAINGRSFIYFNVDKKINFTNYLGFADVVNRGYHETLKCGLELKTDRDNTTSGTSLDTLVRLAGVDTYGEGFESLNHTIVRDVDHTKTIATLYLVGDLITFKVKFSQHQRVMGTLIELWALDTIGYLLTNVRFEVRYD